MSASHLKPATAHIPPVPNTTGGQEVSIVFASRTGLQVFGLLSQSLLAYTLLPEGRGAYAICVMFTVLLGMLFTLSADRGAQYFIMAKQMSVSQGVSLALTTGLAASSLATVLAIPLIHSDLAFFQQADTRSFYLALVLIPLTSMATATDLLLAGLRRFGRLAFFLLLQSLVSVLAVATLVWGLSLGVDGAIISLIVGNSVMVAACLWDLRRHCGLVWEMPSRSGLRCVLGYGLKYHIARMGSQADTRVGVLILGILASRGEIGLFAAASALVFRFMIISNAVGTVLYPRVAGDVGSRPELCALCLRLVCGATASALVALLAISTPLVRILLSEAFLPAVLLIWIMAPGIFVYAGGGMFTTYFLGINRPELSSWAVSIGLCVNVVSFFVLYPPLGVQGAAWAMTLGMFCRMAYLAIAFHRATHMTLTSTWLPQRGDMVYLWASSRSMINRTIGRKSA